MRRILVGLGACCALAACGPATAPSAGSGSASLPTQAIGTSEGIQINTSAEVRVIASDIAAPVDRVFSVLPAVYQQLGIQAGTDPARRSVTGATSFTRRFMGEPATRFLDCGQGSFGTPIASQYTIRMTVSTTVNPGTGDAAGSRLETRVEARAFSSDGANSVAAQCRTEGRLEQMISTLVQGRLAS
jgi:hypothetical protein